MRFGSRTLRGKMSRSGWGLLVAAGLGLSACGAAATGNPIEGIGAAAIAADRAMTEKGEEALGWSVELDTQFVRWRECTSETDCTETGRSGLVGDLKGVSTIGLATVEIDGLSRTVQVKRLRFGPPAPNRPTAATESRARMVEAAPGPSP
jgi:hypothetical protein